MHPFDKLLESLAGRAPAKTLDYLSKDDAYSELKRLSGEDWGRDVAAWKKRRRDILKRLRTMRKRPPIRNAKDAKKTEVELRRLMRRPKT
jgi:hypothetical protein